MHALDSDENSRSVVTTKTFPECMLARKILRIDEEILVTYDINERAGYVSYLYFGDEISRLRIKERRPYIGNEKLANAVHGTALA